MSRIRISGRDFQFFSLFEQLTGAFPRDYICNQGNNEIIFVVKHDQMSKVIGKGGITISRLREEFQRDVRVIQYGDEPESFVANALRPARIERAILEEREGKKVLRVIVSSKREKGRVVGKRGRNINRARLLLRRHFGIVDILVTVIINQICGQNKNKETFNDDEAERSMNKNTFQEMRTLMLENPSGSPCV